MMFLFVLFACDTEEPVYENFSAEISTLEELVEVPEEEVVETDEPEVINNTIYFKSVDISCSELDLRTLTFTEMFPGRAEITSLDAEFYAEAFRYSILDLETTPPIEDNGEPNEEDCLVTLELPEIAEEEGDTGTALNFLDITLFGDEESTEVEGVQWAFLYPAMYAKQDISCGVAENPVAGSKIECANSVSAGTTTTPSSNEYDPQLADNDFYEWGSSVVLVYIKGEISGPFGDLGYEEGWNLVRLDQSEISLVEPINDLDELDIITIDNSNLAARNHIDSLGSTEDTSWPGIEYSIGAAPFRWFEYDAEAETESGYEYVVPDVGESLWILDIYGVPADQYFLTEDDKEDTDYAPYYDQWHAYVPVAPLIPFLFDVLADEDGTQDFVLDSADYRLGAICKNSYMVTYLYFQRPSKPSEALWYQLMDLQPGWYAYLGSHGDANTWQFVLENTTIGLDYDYTSLVIGPSCQLPDDWQTSGAESSTTE